MHIYSQADVGSQRSRPRPAARENVRTLPSLPVRALIYAPPLHSRVMEYAFKLNTSGTISAIRMQIRGSLHRSTGRRLLEEAASSSPCSAAALLSRVKPNNSFAKCSAGSASRSPFQMLQNPQQDRQASRVVDLRPFHLAPGSDLELIVPLFTHPPPPSKASIPSQRAKILGH